MKSAIPALFLATMLSVDVVPHASTPLATPADSGVVMGHLHLAVTALEWGTSVDLTENLAPAK